jgi:hypothetical protein
MLGQISNFTILDSIYNTRAKYPTMTQIYKTIEGLFGKLEERKPLGRPRRRPEDNIKMNLR